MQRADYSYFRIQEEAVEDTWKKINLYINQIPEVSLRKLIRDYANERIHKKRKFRTSLIKGACLTLDKDDLWRDTTDLAAAVELWCISDYFTNNCFDGKFERLPKNYDINSYTIAAAVTRELAQDALTTSIRKLRPEKETEVISSLSQIVKEAYYHQWLDYNDLRLKEGEEIDSKSLEEKIPEIFRKRYELYKTGNFFGQYLKMAAVLLDADERECITLESFGGNLSIGCQIVNDTADLLNEGYDLRNRLLTLPLVYTIIQANKNVYNLDRKDVAQLFIYSGAYKKIIDKTKEIMREAKKYLKMFPKERRAYLSKLATLLIDNKQYRFCKKESEK